MFTRLYQSMRDNPAVRWQVRRRAWPGVTAALAISMVLALLLALVMIISFSTSRGEVSVGERVLLAAGLTAAVIALVLVTIRAALLTARDLGSEKVQLLQLTGLTEMQFVQSYVISTLYVLRVLLIAVLGLAPAVWIGWAHSVSAHDLTRRCLTQPYSCVELGRPLDGGQVFSLLVFLLIVLLILGAALYFAAALGVYVAVRLRAMMLSAGVALALLVMALAPLTYITALLLRAVIETTLRVSGAGLVAMVAITLMLAVALLVMASWMIEDTRRRAWEEVTGAAWLDKPGEY
ncbi:MAG: hypothetical protein IT326_02040 [Anaerolineae bacterium]|nr:hypothetical protein [Anaerolineae bacterium]